MSRKISDDFSREQFAYVLSYFFRAYRGAVHFHNSAPAEAARFKCDETAQAYRRYWNNLLGEDTLHEVAFGELEMSQVINQLVEKHFPRQPDGEATSPRVRP